MSNITKDITKFVYINCVDTCALQNIFSSNKLYNASIVKCKYIISGFVKFESLDDEWKGNKKNEVYFKKRYKEEIEKGNIEVHNITLDDLTDVEMTKKFESLGIGEVTTIILARKFRQAFLSDDKEAKSSATDYLTNENVQTSPQLCGHLFFITLLKNKSDMDIIEQEYISNNPTDKMHLHFRTMYEEAMRILEMQKLFTKN